MCRHEGRVRTWGEGGRRLAEERTLRRSPPCPHLALGVPPPELRKINSCCLSPLGLRHFVSSPALPTAIHIGGPGWEQELPTPGETPAPQPQKPGQ